MKILQLPTEIAGQVNLTAKGLRAVGYDAKNASRVKGFGYPMDINSHIADLPYLRNIRNPFLFFLWVKEYDIFHYHKSAYLPKGIDVKYLAKKHKPFFIEFWGSEIRQAEREQERNPFFSGDNSGNPKKKIKRLEFWSSMTDEVIMSDNSADIYLKPYFDKIHIVRQRVDTSLYRPVFPDLETTKPKIIHAPSAKSAKGTQFVHEAVDKLKKMGLDFEYIEVHGMSHSEAMKIYPQADIIIDQLTLGSHGVFACEAMSLGKPVICYIMDDLIDTYPEGFPIINANPNTITEVLEELILSPKIRNEIGKTSRAYVEREHDIKVVAKRLMKIYESKLN